MCLKLLYPDFSLAFLLLNLTHFRTDFIVANKLLKSKKGETCVLNLLTFSRFPLRKTSSQINLHYKTKHFPFSPSSKIIKTIDSEK